MKDFCDVTLLNGLFSLASCTPLKLDDELRDLAVGVTATLLGTADAGFETVCFAACIGRTDATLAGLAVIGESIGSLFGSLDTVVVTGTDICFETDFELLA